jgi:histidine ammonia-lyase
MGSISARKLHSVLENIEYIHAIELLYATQALDFRRPLKSTPVVEACHDLVREYVPFIDHDRVFADDINQIHKLLMNGDFLNKALEIANQHQLNLFKDDDFGIY